MNDSRGGGRRYKNAIGLIAVALLGAAAPARAQSVKATITPPATAVVEDAEFAISFAGDVSSLPGGEGYVEARTRPGTQRPCAANQLADPGDPVIFSPPGSNHVAGAFGLGGRYTPDAPGEYLVCAWIEDAFGVSGPPVSAAVTVRPPVLRIAATAPRRAAVGEPFDVTVDYAAEVSRYLTVLVVRATRCPLTGQHLAAIFGWPAIIADNVEVAGPGSLTRTVRLRRPGTYLVCGYLDERFLGSSMAQLAVTAATVVVPGFRRCGSPGGRRHITDLRARGVSCASARSVALRWGARLPTPRRVGRYRCLTRSGRVTCTAGTAAVRFRYGRPRI